MMHTLPQCEHLLRYARALILSLAVVHNGIDTADTHAQTHASTLLVKRGFYSMTYFLDFSRLNAKLRKKYLHAEGNVGQYKIVFDIVGKHQTSCFAA